MSYTRLRENFTAKTVSWALALAVILSCTFSILWVSAPKNAGLIQVLLPFPLTVLGNWLVMITSLTLARVAFVGRFHIVEFPAVAAIALPLALVEDIPILSSAIPQFSTSLLHGIPILGVLAMVAFVPKARTVDRILFLGVAIVVASLHILFHLLLSIPQADLARQTQADFLQMLALQDPASLTQSALDHGGVLLSTDVIHHPFKAGPLPYQWGESADVVFANLQRLLQDAPPTTFVTIEPGNTVFERIGYLYDGRLTAEQGVPRIFLFPSTATNQALMIAQRAHMSLAALGNAFWLIAAMLLSALHARIERRRGERRPIET